MNNKKREFNSKPLSEELASMGVRVINVLRHLPRSVITRYRDDLYNGDYVVFAADLKNLASINCESHIPADTAQKLLLLFYRMTSVGYIINPDGYRASLTYLKSIAGVNKGSASNVRS